MDDAPSPLGGVDAQVVETHTSVLFFVGDRVYKLKKGVDLGFLDFSTREARLEACHQEVALNRRLSPDAYLGVADLLGTDGELCDHLVVMRRMPDERRLTRCIERGEDVTEALREIAHEIAALHDSSPPDARHDRLATVSDVRARWVAGFEQIGELERSDVERARDDRIAHLVNRYLDGRRDLFEYRIRRGRVRDGHGDLLAEDIFLMPDGPQILDCLEFSEDYRWGDVLADVAFLAMDLERLGRRDLADQFLALHRELSGDHWPASLGHHYVAYRAHVRAKVGLMRAAQAGTEPGPDVEALFELAASRLEAGRVRLVVVGGAPGTGKSTVAAALGDRFEAVVLRTDEVRGRVCSDNAYSEAEVQATYDQMLADAGRLLRMGESVVLDATFGDAGRRGAYRRLAADAHADLTELRCAAPVAVASSRIVARLAVGRDASEATPEVARRLAESFAPWPEAVELDTLRPPAEVVTLADAAVRSTPAGDEPARIIDIVHR